ARMIPVLVAGVSAVLTGAQLIWQNVSPQDHLRVDALELFVGRDVRTKPGPTAGSNPRETSASSSSGARDGQRSEWQGIAWLAGLLALVYLIGLLPAVVVF